MFTIYEEKKLFLRVLPEHVRHQPLRSGGLPTIHDPISESPIEALHQTNGNIMESRWSHESDMLDM